MKKLPLKVALITGITGQDGSYMAELLLSNGYEVHGLIRRSSSFNTGRIDHIRDQITLHYGDLTDSMNLVTIISKILPTEIYNFAAQSHVKVSAELERYTIETNTLGILSILQAVKLLGLEKTTKIYQAGTSEEFGNQTDGKTLLNETSPKIPVSIYGVSKLAAEHICNIYRDAYGMFVVCSTLFNHEECRRGPTFVTQKVATWVARWKSGKEKTPLQIGNLDSIRDWGSAKDYVEGIYLMMQRETPQNYILATGECHSVREFIELAFKEVGVEIFWDGKGLEEKGKCKKSGEVLVEVNKKYFRDLELDVLIGDASKAKRELGWEPKTTFGELVSRMVSGKE